MRKLVLVEFLTVDGVMQGLASPEEDTDGGFTHGGWGIPYSAAIHESVARKPSNTSAFLFGRRTYERMAAFWPTQPDSNRMAAQLNTLPKYVASRTLSTSDWKPTEFLEGDLASAITALKHEGESESEGQSEGDIVVLGSGMLVDQLMRLDLVDEIRLFIHPLLLGTGKRLFRELPDPRRLKLTSSATTGPGTVILTYDVLRA